MFKSEKAKQEWRFYLDDMIDFARKVLLTQPAGFIASELTYGATLRNLELIGEAATLFNTELTRSAG